MMLVGSDAGSLRARLDVNKWREAAFIFSAPAARPIHFKSWAILVGGQDAHRRQSRDGCATSGIARLDITGD